MQTESALEAHRKARPAGRADYGDCRLPCWQPGSWPRISKARRKGRELRAPARCWRPSRLRRRIWASARAIVHAIDWLFTFTQPQDWLRAAARSSGRRPLYSAMRLALVMTQAKALNRHLVELGLVTMKDSPNGKRYGKRDRQGRIARGLRVRSVAAVHPHGGVSGGSGSRAGRFATACASCAGAATIARNGLLQILETVAELGLQRRRPGSSLRQRAGRSPARSRASSGSRRWSLASPAWSDGSLRHANGWKISLPRAVRSRLKQWILTPRGRKTDPTNTTTKQPLILNKNTVIASEESKARVAMLSHIRQRQSADRAGRRAWGTVGAEPTRHRTADQYRRTGAPGPAAAPLSADILAQPGPTSSRRPTGCGTISASRSRFGAKPASRYGPRKGCHCARDRLGETGRAFHRFAGELFPRHGYPRQERRTQSRADALGAPRRPTAKTRVAAPARSGSP